MPQESPMNRDDAIDAKQIAQMEAMRFLLIALIDELGPKGRKEHLFRHNLYQRAYEMFSNGIPAEIENDDFTLVMRTEFIAMVSACLRLRVEIPWDKHLKPVKPS